MGIMGRKGKFKAGSGDYRIPAQKAVFSFELSLCSFKRNLAEFLH